MNDMNKEPDLEKFQDDPADEIKPIDIGESRQPSMPPSLEHPQKDKEEDKDKQEHEHREKEEDEIPEEPAKRVFDNERNRIKKGGYINLLDKCPSLKNISIELGWDQKSPEGEEIDVDISCFLLDKENKTRIDEDFIFYNNPAACDGAIKHMGDSRTGAGEGTDESILMDLNGIPFDVLKIIFVLSIYDENLNGLTFDLVRNVYLSLLNKEDLNEIVFFEIEEGDTVGASAITAITLIREGPKWFVEAQAEPVVGGLAAAATSYGIIIREDTG